MSQVEVFAWLKVLMVGVVAACGGHGGAGGHHGGGSGGGSGGGGTGGGGTSPSYSVGGTVTGLVGSGLILNDNGGDALAVTQSGAFVFAKKLKDASPYSVTVTTQPGAPKQTCNISQGSGTIAGSDVKTVQVTCATVPLTLTSSTPVNGATGVVQTGVLKLTFSAPLNASTATTTNITLLAPGGTAPISVATSGNTLTITPASALVASAPYTLVVTTAVTGAAGEQLAGVLKISFQTAGTPWTPLIGRTVTLSASNEGYYCRTIQVDSDLYIKGFRASTGPLMSRAFLTVAPAAPLGDFECNGTTNGPKMIFAAAAGTNDFSFPAGFGVHVQAGQKLLLSVHVVNTGVTTVTEDEQILIQTGTATEVTTAAEMILLGTQNFAIPDGTHTIQGYWLPQSNQQVLALLPLMRSRATHQTVTLTRQDVAQNLLDMDFDPLAAQSYHSLTDVFFEPGDRLTAVCTFVVTGGTVYYGQDSYDETCFSAAYLAPSVDLDYTVGYGG